MRHPNRSLATCALTGRQLPRSELVSLDDLRPSLAERIRQQHPDLPHEALIAQSEVKRFRSQYVEEMLRDESGEISELERRVAASLDSSAMLSRNIEAQFDKQRTIGEVLSDRISGIG